MTLPLVGQIGARAINSEIGRAVDAPFSIDGTEERYLAKVLSGSIALSDFYGKTADVIRDFTDGANKTIQSLFTAEQWVSQAKKIAIIPHGVEIGATSPLLAALKIGDIPWAGDLELRVSGTISGAGGNNTNPIGGDAFDANILSSTGQPIAIVVASGGVLRGGGGAGGLGGVGGNGWHQVHRVEGPYFQENVYQWTTGRRAGSGMIFWGGQYIFGTNGGDTSRHHGGYFYQAAGYVFERHSTNRDEGTTYTYYYQIQRSWTENVNTYGGAGGAGARGAGYMQTAGIGANGSAGGVNAGGGGKGGDGGAYGAAGFPGSPGGNGNVGNGQQGSLGGAPGNYLKGAGNANLVNDGTLLGSLI